MNNKQIVRKLINGSEAIDRMKGEINRVVTMVMGLVVSYKVSTDREWRTPQRKQKNMLHLTYATFSKILIDPSNYKWGVEFFYAPESTVLQWVVRCVLHDTLVYTSHSGAGEASLRLGHIKGVHESLPVFVKEMSREFPFLKKDWQPILDAAGE